MDEDSTSNSNVKNILLVDDEQFVLVAYKEGLEHAGYNVTIAHDGEEALTVLNTLTPDLIILDLIMPKISGFEVLQSLKSNENLKNIPVFVLTNLSQESDELEARSYGIADFMIKADLSLQEVIARVSAYLSDY